MSATGNSLFGKTTFTLNTTSWFFWNATKDVYYVSLKHLIDTINNNLPKDGNFKGIDLNIDSATKVTAKIKSANPLNVLNQAEGAANYYSNQGGPDFSWSADSPYFISFDFLEKIEYYSPDDKSDNPHATKNTLIQFIRKVLDEINNCLGDSIKLELIPYGQSGEGTEHGYEIVDRKTLIQNLSNTTVLNPLNRTAKLRNMSVQSTIDSEIAAIALSSAQSNKNKGVVEGVFGCKREPLKLENSKQDLVDMYQSFAQLDETILNDCIQTLKKICNVELPQQIGYKYGVTLTVTVDGYPKHLFGKIFKVSGLPTMLSKSNVYFIVLKQGHKFDNGDWTMDLEGQMMFDIRDKVTITNGFDPTNGLLPLIKIAPPAQAAVDNTYVALGPKLTIDSTWVDITDKVISNLEGGYYNDVWHKSDAMGRSGETLFGLDRKNGGSLNTTPQGLEFWKLVDENKNQTEWEYLYQPGGLLGVKLRSLLSQIMENLYDNLSKTHLKQNIKIVNSSPKLKFHFAYACWNGSGYFQTWAENLNQRVAKGTTNVNALFNLGMQDRRNTGIALFKKGASIIEAIFK